MYAIRSYYEMDRSGADFHGVVQQMVDKLGAHPVPVQIPIGSEDKFVGLIDLLEMNAVIFEDGVDPLTNFTIQPIPEFMAAEAEEWRMKLVEACAEMDDSILERYLEDHESITPDEIIAVLRRETIQGLDTRADARLRGRRRITEIDPGFGDPGGDILGPRSGMDIGHLAVRRREVLITPVPLDTRQFVQERGKPVDRVVQ